MGSAYFQKSKLPVSRQGLHVTLTTNETPT
jgi:hypothetical protein